MAITIVNNLVLIIAIIIAAIDKQLEAKFAMYLFIFILVLLNVTLFTMYQSILSTIIFEKDVIKCVFLGRIRRVIPVNTIREYGVFWERGLQFIYISRRELSEYQRREQMFKMYKKNKDILVMQYQEEAMKYLQEYVVLENQL